jgi:hypothetical protein
VRGILWQFGGGRLIGQDGGGTAFKRDDDGSPRNLHVTGSAIRGAQLRNLMLRGEGRPQERSWLADGQEKEQEQEED